ncbi:coiled-coil domain-containing protein [Obesumbacterium proteus]|uniref:cell envelope biogenesis protein TolA n=1 Tax=Obesumbacterium proteus TaxID=82983 RepID=UPI001F28468F|nr:cell envelope biogenesis protein TolA [Obesumbacterium proteus]MCE9886211.1 cell envelope biogenesis protein TolA [Obesumbacterium proteus]MCE9914883.1 cell envelope biogenesis protein TolA [Obesumbacterium proteus]MCE9931608.1 cell envelope biogenesis protein TolA [Obesumbacterium proteus]MCG2876067.1 cell envelope biogenesis protein TolA [Obesumbacterium proteus]
MSEEKNEIALVTLPSVPAELEAAFINDEFIEGLLKDVREKASSVVGDLSTVKGRRAYISMAANVRSTKTAIDDASKKLVAEMKKRPALVDASRKKVRDSLDELAVEIRKPVTDWEAEQKEKEFNAMWDEALDLDAKITAERAAALAAKIEADHEMALLMNEKIDRDRDEARQKAEQAKREHEERIKREAEEKARHEAEEAAKREIEAAAAREREALLAKELAERERIESEQRAEREKQEALAKAERERIAAEEKAKREKEEAIQRERAAAEAREQARLAEEKRIKDEEARRAADKEHRKTINNKALQDLIAAGVPEECAKLCITAIAKGNITAISINY